DLGGLIVIDFIDMESAKSQRDVENRLRDALHFDRARVQTSKISRFGLLELSRQRLRPALAETSYITCPRCTGTGHIRSTESAALHILRILEEEAMKENTGAIHVQVPVDVATFLLNEKRVDIARIEMRHRANLLIIPNRHLETPQHEITRLRHDQLNQDGPILASYEMAVKPIEEDLSTLAAQAEGKPARAEAAVKGITPDQPAPIVAPKEPPPVAAAPGLFAKIMSWFSGDKKEAEVVTPAKSTDKPVRRERSERGERGGRGRRDNREGREGSERKERGERKERDTSRGDNRQNRKERPEKGNDARRDNRNGEPRIAETPGTATATEARPARSRAAEKEKPQQESAAIIAGSPIENPAAESTGEGTRRRGRRGGRGRSERHNEEAAAAVTGTEVAANVAQTESAAAGETAAVPHAEHSIAAAGHFVPPAPAFSPAEQAAIAAEPTTVAVAEPAAAVAIPEPTPAIEAPAPVLASETGMVTEVATAVPTEALIGTPVEPITPAPAAEPVAVLISPETPAAPQAPTTIAPPVAPVETVSAVAPTPPIDLSASLQQAGLQMVETSNAVVVPVAPSTAQPLGRKPKPAVVIAAEPLQMVETQHKA
ncbi:MAG: ribonuclease E/G, partial [Rhodocyclaceae bacterium]|nr:ribonuclease E/G [Rhodocyclaceae bacterium]